MPAHLNNFFLFLFQLIKREFFLVCVFFNAMVTPPFYLGIEWCSKRIAD